ncbi:hypothetical protein CYY_000094 [Polysphondylium violaceum]|uniref:Uncharacterized protein n=1 Tax=Polysphondylium violaceum TaxID=133409 RepID=A0A8J4Q5C1_9MYCE|nr:hypothetical protein CYY_000094 [Polysphondylium violaceum]
MHTTTVTTTPTLLFFSIFKNKFLAKKILDLCKCQDRVAYAYYDIPFALLFKTKRFAIFDHRWSLGAKIIHKSDTSGSNYDDEHLKYIFDVRYQDVIAFFSNNDCIDRLKRVWKLFFQIVKANVDIMRHDDMDTILAHLLLLDANRELELYWKFYKKNISSSYMFGAQQTPDLLTKIIGQHGSSRVYDQAFRLLGAEITYKCMKYASQFGNIDLFHHIFQQAATKQNRIIYYLADFKELSGFLLANVDSSLLRVSYLPWDGMCTTDYDFIEKIIQKFKPTINFPKAYEIGDLKLLDYLCNRYSHLPNRIVVGSHLANFETFQWLLEKSPTLNPISDIEYACQHSVMFYKHLAAHGFNFTAKTFDAPYPILEYIDQTNAWPAQFSSAFIKKNYHQDIRIIKLLHRVYKDDFQVSVADFKTFVSRGCVDIVKYLIENESSKLLFIELYQLETLIFSINNNELVHLFYQVISFHKPHFAEQFVTQVKNGFICLASMEIIKKVTKCKCLLVELCLLYDRMAQIYNLDIPVVYEYLLDGFDQEQWNGNYLTVALLHAIRIGNVKFIRYITNLISRLSAQISIKTENLFINFGQGFFGKTLLETYVHWNQETLVQILCSKYMYTPLLWFVLSHVNDQDQYTHLLDVTINTLKAEKKYDALQQLVRCLKTPLPWRSEPQVNNRVKVHPPFKSKTNFHLKTSNYLVSNQIFSESEIFGSFEIDPKKYTFDETNTYDHSQETEIFGFNRDTFKFDFDIE